MLDRGVDRIPVRRAGFISRVVTSIVRLILPVIALCAAFALSFCLRDMRVPELAILSEIDPILDPSDWANWGFLVLPVVFFILNLTSRRYGAALALTAALLAWLALGGALFWALREGLIGDFQEAIAPYAVAASFVGAMAVAQLVNILFFDWLRGIPWWKAPFFAALAGGVVFAIVFNTRPALVWDSELGARLAVESLIHFSWALAQLLPTAILRRTIRPLPGFGGA
ncbi:hypothetical protein Plav_1707 [Parvibaculum lavamentivorans DS-1]|uniref:Uncharacterized protein n=1 Tax=Parvibaculum lavamentivorans (strain DS-1 / DSM 13023 / NCIMB 13966) TaxID=402881 RepID=A7HTU3_PARL1|nr:hypothetical protein [Parvibaculum lavamentivorans]ABS63326.1 hypothetical protein Plav_1707 [Parvibaculum lavamentivorans DS-1]